MKIGPSVFYVILKYFSGLFMHVVNSQSHHAIAYHKLKGLSFDISQKFRFSYKIILSGIWQVVSFPINDISFARHNPLLIYDLDSHSQKDRVNYLNYYGVQGAFDFISAPSLLYFNSRSDKLFFLIATLPIQLHVLVYGLFKREKSGLSSVLKNILITRNFLFHSKKYSKIYIFSIYDTNSAFLSNCLLEKKIAFAQITSEVPLYKWNKYIVTDELILCLDYQLLEVEKFNKSIKFNSYKFFGPEASYKTSGMYERPQTKNFKIGFYSTGGWVRNRLGHIDQGNNMEISEVKILKDLNTILSKRDDLHLIVYPHPRERTFFNNSESELYNYYRNFLSEINFEINKKNESSHLLFDDVYLAICYMTTLIFERSFSKRKSVIAYFQEKDFPIKRKFDYLDIVDNREELMEIIALNY